MTSKWTAVIQLALTALQGLNVASVTQYLDFLPPKWAALAVVLVGSLQGLLAWRAKFSNPDGTPATQPWKP